MSSTHGARRSRGTSSGSRKPSMIQLPGTMAYARKKTGTRSRDACRSNSVSMNRPISTPTFAVARARALRRPIHSANSPAPAHSMPTKTVAAGNCHHPSASNGARRSWTSRVRPVRCWTRMVTELRPSRIASSTFASQTDAGVEEPVSGAPSTSSTRSGYARPSRLPSRSAGPTPETTPLVSMKMPGIGWA